MSSVVAFSVFGVDWEFLKPYIVLGLALGGVYALSGVGIVVLYQATGVLNLAFGAVGAAGALIAYWMINHTSWPHWLAYATCVAFGGVVNLVYGVLFGPAFAKRDPLVKMMGTLGLALILLGIMAWRAPAGGAFVRVLILPSSSHRYEIFGASVNLTQILALAFALALTVWTTLFLRYTALGTAYRASRTTGRSPPRSVCRSAASRRQRGSAPGIVCGASGLLLADLYTSLDYSALTFLVISSLAAALIGRLNPSGLTLAGGITVGFVQAVLTPYGSVTAYRAATPFVLSIIALLWMGRRRVVVFSPATR